MGSEKKRGPFFWVLVCALLWGTAFPGLKTVYRIWEGQGLALGLPLLCLYAGIRFVAAGAALLMRGGNWRQEFEETPWRPLAAMTFGQTFFQYVFFYQAIAVANAGLASLLVGTGSFWWVCLAPLIAKTPWPSGKQWLALLLGGIGGMLAVYSPGVQDGEPLLGAAFMLAATGCGAVGLIYFRKVGKTMSSVNATGLSLLIGGAGLCLVGAGELKMIPVMFESPLVIGITMWLALVSAVAFSLWNSLSRRYPVPLLASYRFLIPLCGILEAFLLLGGDWPGGLFWIGAAMVLAAAVLVRTWGELEREGTDAGSARSDGR